MPIKWNLRMVMAQRGIWSGSDLQRLLEQKAGVRLSSAGISRLLREQQAEIKLRLLDGLCIVLDCQPEELMILHKEEKTADKVLKNK